MQNSDPLKEIQTRLEKYPDARCFSTDCSIMVEPTNEDGFPVEFTVNATEYTVAFDGWHEQFENMESALNCLAFGLSEMCRLKITSCGRKPYKWTVQSWKNDTWVDDSTTGLLFFAFWKKSKTTYRRNRLIKFV